MHRRPLAAVVIRGFGLISASLGLVLVGCGNGNSTTSSPAYTVPTTTQVDSGCNPVEPRHVEVTPSSFGTLLHVCSSTNGSTVRVENISSTVIRVSPRSRGSTLRLEPSTATSFVEEATAAAVPGQCSVSACSLPGRAAAIAQGPAPVILGFDVDYSQTTSAVVASALAGYVQGRLQTPGQRLANSVATCATAAGQFAQNNYWQDALRSAITGSSNCGDLLHNILGEPVAEESTVAEEVTGFARRVGGGTWIDALTYGGAEILTHR